MKKIINSNLVVNEFGLHAKVEEQEYFVDGLMVDSICGCIIDSIMPCQDATDNELMSLITERSHAWRRW